MKIIGITGGIGSGKTTISNILRSKGFYVFDSDIEARNICNNNNEVRNQIKSLFGSDIYTDENILDRKKLANIVFNDRGLLNSLNAIVHPKTRQRMNNLIDEHSGSRLFFVESAIMFESGLVNNMDCVINVTALEKTRIERVRSRDKISSSQVKEKIDNQMSEDERINRCDFVITTDVSMDKVEKSVDYLINHI